jgi:hypothetical protein
MSKFISSVLASSAPYLGFDNSIFTSSKMVSKMLAMLKLN